MVCHRDVSWVRWCVGFVGVSWSVDGVSCVFWIWRVVLLCHSTGGAVSWLRWQSGETGRLDPYMLEGVQGYQD